MALVWKNLLNGKCPRCGEELSLDSYDNKKCVHCKFFCHSARANQIILEIKLKQRDEIREKLVNAEACGYDVR